MRRGMEKFDAIVIGAGSGLNIVDAAAKQGINVALVENGPMGGTCLNRGCIPSKMLIHSADVAETIQTAKKFGINTKITSVDFKRIVTRVNHLIDKDARRIEKGIRSTENITLFKTQGRFVGPKTLRVGNRTIQGEKVFVFAGTRSLTPTIEGLKESGCITSTEALRLKIMPKTLTIIGGGYIAAELAHFFGTLGSNVTIIQRNNTLVPNEDTEIAQAFTKIYQKRFNVLLDALATKVQKRKRKFIVTAVQGNRKKTVASDQLLLAVGRVPNTDMLDVKKAGIETNEQGFIKTNEYLETTAEGVWAGGDIAGKYLFKHSSNLESQYMYHNAFHPESKQPADYYAMPHAIFCSPQIAGVGMREQDIKPGTYVVGKYWYKDTGMGAALQDDTGFVKILVKKGTGKILGCHIIGTDASTLIHEVIVAMKSGNATVDNITKAIHVHPALSEVVQRAALNAKF